MVKIYNVIVNEYQIQSYRHSERRRRVRIQLKSGQQKDALDCYGAERLTMTYTAALYTSILYKP